MSDAATKDRAIKRHWAEPGSRHDKTVRAAKFGLPIVIGGLVLLLAIAPFEQKGEVSFILDKNKVENVSERMRVETARYVGADNKGQQFEIIARQALQRSSEIPVVDIQGMFARLALANGPLMIAANQGRYDLDTQQMAVSGPVRVVGPDGYRLETRDVLVDLKQRQLASSGPVAGQMRLGQFQAGRLRADLGERKVVLDGGTRLKIVQGAVR
jgi:lipopolysaccharide export system protein LptC